MLASLWCVCFANRQTPAFHLESEISGFICICFVRDQSSDTKHIEVFSHPATESIYIKYIKSEVSSLYHMFSYRSVSNCAYCRVAVESYQLANLWPSSKLLCNCPIQFHSIVYATYRGACLPHYVAGATCAPHVPFSVPIAYCPCLL